jgi:hypothetical protein
MDDTPITIRKYTDFDEIKAEDVTAIGKAVPRMNGWTRWKK